MFFARLLALVRRSRRLEKVKDKAREKQRTPGVNCRLCVSPHTEGNPMKWVQPHIVCIRSLFKRWLLETAQVVERHLKTHDTASIVNSTLEGYTSPFKTATV
jgi:hypothetical protein